MECQRKCVFCYISWHLDTGFSAVFGDVVIWMEAACAQISWSQDTFQEKGDWRHMKTKVEGSTCKDHGNHCPPYEQKKSLKTLKNQPLSGIHGEGRTQDKPWPWRDSKGNTGNPGFLEHRLSSRIYSFSSSPGTFSKRPHAGHKTHPNTFQRVEAIQQLLSDLYEIKLELNHSKKSWDIPK